MKLECMEELLVKWLVGYDCGLCPQLCCSRERQCHGGTVLAWMTLFDLIDST